MIDLLQQLNGFKGHLLFLGVFAIFVIILFAGLFFSYIFAAKKTFSHNPGKLFEIPEQGKKFTVKKEVIAISGILLIISPFVMWHFFKLLKQEPENADALWFLIDLLILAIIIFLLLFLTGLRSYVYVHQGGIEYKKIIRKESYISENIEFISESSNFLFIKLKSSKFPVVLETIYTDYGELVQMLCSLKKSLTNYLHHNENLP